MNHERADGRIPINAERLANSFAGSMVFWGSSLLEAVYFKEENSKVKIRLFFSEAAVVSDSSRQTLIQSERRVLDHISIYTTTVHRDEVDIEVLHQDEKEHLERDGYISVDMGEIRKQVKEERKKNTGFGKNRVIDPKLKS